MMGRGARRAGERPYPAQRIPLAALLLQRQRGSTRDVGEAASSEATSDWCETGERDI
jgi:hypothetical protein